MLAIYRRELKSYFSSFIGLLFIGVSLFFVGLYYTVYNIMYGYPYFSYAVSSVIFIFLLTVPILTMKILAEERHNKTDQLILTAPVSVGQIVMGKYLALLTIFAIPTAIVSFYPLILTMYGSVPLAECYLAVLGYFLYGATAIAVGLVISSLTESQVIAAVLSFGALFLGYMMSSICGLLSSEGNLLTEILGLFDMYTPFAMLLNGTLDVASIVYFLSIIAICLFLASQIIQKRRYSVSVKHFSLGAYSTVSIAIFIGVVVILNLIVGKLPGTITSIDVTSQKLYSITDTTKSLLDELEEDITLYVYVNEEECDTTVKQTLQRYDDYSEHITVEYVDPILNPKFAANYTSSSVYTNSVIVVSDARSKVVNYSDMYESTYDYYTYTSNTTGYDAEGQITSAIAYVTSTDIPKVYMITGHGESSLAYGLTGLLEKANVETVELPLMTMDAVPEDAACIVFNSPITDINDDDTKKVLTYMENGGKVVFVAGESEKPLENFASILGYMDITLTDGYVIEADSEYYYQVPYYLLPSVTSSEHTAGVSGTYPIFVPYSNGFILPNESEDVSYDSFLTTSETAYTQIGEGENSTEYIGAFSIGVEAQKETDNGTATLVAYASSQMFTDDASDIVGGANQMVFANTINKFAGHEVTISVPVKSYETSYITMTQSNVIVYATLTCVILPLICIILGFVIWFKRRRK